MLEDSFYRRPLPAAQIPLSSAEGRSIFREALAEGNMEGYFAVAEQFHTQSDPAFCGLGTLVVALNALSVDPGRLWKGPWRWYGEEMLDCCTPLDRIRVQGLTLDEFACLARCNGARAEVTRPTDAAPDAFRDALRAVCSSASAGVLAVAYSRRLLGQTGEGHFSPLAGFHAGRDLALVLDVARFKYPPHWVRVTDLYEAMRPIDPATGRARGWVRIERGEGVRTLLFRFGSPPRPWEEIIGAASRAIAQALAEGEPRDEAELAGRLLRALPPSLIEVIEVQTEGLARVLDEQHRTRIDEVATAIRASAVYVHARAALRALDTPWVERPYAAELATVLLLVLPDAWLPRAGAARDSLMAHRRADALAPALAAEIATLREQMQALREHFCCA